MTFSNVLKDNTLVVLQFIEAVLKIQPTVRAVLHVVKGSTQLPSFLRDAGSEIRIHIFAKLTI